MRKGDFLFLPSVSAEAVGNDSRGKRKKHGKSIAINGAAAAREAGGARFNKRYVFYEMIGSGADPWEAIRQATCNYEARVLPSCTL
jgi:hypothetical protein